MKKNNLFICLVFLTGIIFCESFDYVYVDDNTLYRQLSYIKNGFVAIVLQIDPTQKNTSKNYATAGKIIKEKIIQQKVTTSTELIQLILNVIKRNQKFSGEGWYPTYDVYIKYTDRFFFFIPIKRYMAILFDFKNSILFIEGRKFVFNEQEAKLLQTELEYLLNKPVS